MDALDRVFKPFGRKQKMEYAQAKTEEETKARKDEFAALYLKKINADRRRLGLCPLSK